MIVTFWREPKIQWCVLMWRLDVGLLLCVPGGFLESELQLRTALCKHERHGRILSSSLSSPSFIFSVYILLLPPLFLALSCV